MRKKFSWAFYISENSKRSRCAYRIKIFRFFFPVLEKDLECQVLSFNKSVINLHLKYGFKIVETKKFLNRFEKKHDLIISISI